MMKKIVFLFLVLGLFGGGFFYWRQSQADVRELNKNLPDGVKVTKSLFGNEYRVVNKIDGYNFKVPAEWKGLEWIEYMPSRSEDGYTGSSINLKGNESSGRLLGIDRFSAGGDMNADLESWAKSEFDTFGLIGDFSKDKVDEYEIIKTQENTHLGGESVYFFRKNQIVYSMTSPSENFIKEIILNGKW